MRAPVMFLIGLLAGACARPVEAPAPPTRGEVVEGLTSKSVALVRRDEDGDPHAYCSGSWVGPSTFVTAAHCVEDEGPGVSYVTYEDVYASGRERPQLSFRFGGVAAVDPMHDLALVHAPNAPTHQIARLALESVHVGARAQKMGQGLGMWWSYASGDVAAVRDGGEIVSVQATTPISPGDSGCGLFDADGGLMAVARGSFLRGQNVNMFVHAQHVDALMRRQWEL